MTMTEVRATASRPAVIAAAVLVVVAVAFLWYASSQLNAPFGESHDGINGATWGNGSRYLREVGPIDAALGGRRPDGDLAYANHPPLIYPLTAVAELVVGEHPWSTRAPAWLASLVSIPLLWLVLRRLRLGVLPAAIGVVGAATTPMLFVYGAMLDTPVVGFPVGLAVFLVWLRAWDDEESPPWLVFGLALVAGLIAWQAVFAVGLAAVSLFWRSRRRGGRTTTPLALAAGGALGVVLTGVWAAWATGSATGLLDQFRNRSGSEGGATWSGMVSHQAQWLSHLLGMAVVGLFACLVVAIRERGLRQAAAIASLAVVAGYAVLLHSGAYVHQYWCYWVVLPVAIGLGIGADALGTVLRDRGMAAATTTAVLIALTVVLILPSRIAVSGDRTMMDEGDVPARLLQAHDLPADQDTMWYIGAIYGPEPWMTYLTGRPTRSLDDPAQLVALARDHPDALLFGTNSCVDGDQLCVAAAKLPADAAVDQATDASGTRYRLFTAEQLASHLQPTG